MNKKANIILTHNCNLRCKHCYLDAKPCKENFEDNYRTSIEIIDKLKIKDFREIMFTGGECMIFPKLEDLIKYVKSKGFVVSIFTNGMVYNEKIFDLVDIVHISIDGSEQIHNDIRQNSNSFANIIKVLDYLKKIDKYTIIQMTINNKNYDDVDFLVNLTLDHLNIRTVKFAFTSSSGRAVENNIYSDKSMIEYINNKLSELFNKTKYHIQFLTNLFNKYDFENYCLTGISDFPFWIDIPENNYYLLNGEISKIHNLNDLNLETIETESATFLKILNDNREKIERNENIDIEFELTNLLGGK